MHTTDHSLPAYFPAPHRNSFSSTSQVAVAEDRAASLEEGYAAQVLHRLEPLEDARWDSFLESHPGSSLFHSSGWLDSLRRTYGYDCQAFSTSAPGEALRNAVVFCRVDSWLTGKRLVSLPFSDHCAPLLHAPGDMDFFLSALTEEAKNSHWRYIELRPVESIRCRAQHCVPSATYAFHQLDLRPDLNAIYANFHKNSIQRKIQRAERERLIYEESSGAALLDAFYRLMILTRRRHHVPPQPKSWFRNLCNRFGDALKIRIARRETRPVAGMLTIRHKNTMVYKYGAADAAYNNLGGMHLVYWKTIQDAKELGLETLDFGRADADQEGLITFKQRWGATESNLTYYRLTASSNAQHVFDPNGTSWKMRLAKQAFAHSPAPVLSLLGKVLYKHIG